MKKPGRWDFGEKLPYGAARYPAALRLPTLVQRRLSFSNELPLAAAGSSFPANPYRAADMTLQDFGSIGSFVAHGYARHIRSVMRAPAVRRWRKFRKSVFAPELRKFIDGPDGEPSVLGLSGVLEEMRSDESAPD